MSYVFGHRSLNSCNCRRGHSEFLSVSQILTKDISGHGPQNVAVVPVSHTFEHKSVDSSTKLRNWPPKGVSLEVTFAPAIAVARYENGGLDTHAAKGEFADGFVQKYVFVFVFSNNIIFKLV